MKLLILSPDMIGLKQHNWLFTSATILSRWYAGRRRSAHDWSYTLDANDLALFAGRGFTSHEYLPWFKLYNMNGRLGVYPAECNGSGNPIVGRVPQRG